MSSVTLDAEKVIAIACGTIEALLADQRAKIDAIADAVIAASQRSRIRYLTRVQPVTDRTEAIQLLETKYGYNEELLAELIAAKQLHKMQLQTLYSITVAARLSISSGDGRITLSLEHASMLQRKPGETRDSSQVLTT